MANSENSEQYTTLSQKLISDLHDLIVVLDSSSSDHVASTLAAEWGRFTQQAMQVLAAAEVDRTRAFERSLAALDQIGNSPIGS